MAREGRVLLLTHETQPQKEEVERELERLREMVEGRRREEEGEEEGTAV